MNNLQRAESGQHYQMANLHTQGGAAGSSGDGGFSQAMQSHAAPDSPRSSTASFRTAEERTAGQDMKESDGTGISEPKGKGKETALPQASTKPSADPIQSAGLGSQGFSPVTAQSPSQSGVGVAGPSNSQGQAATAAAGTSTADAASAIHRRASQTAVSNADATIMNGVNRISPDQRGTAQSSLTILDQQEKLMNGIIAKGQPRPDPNGHVTEEGGQPSLTERQNALQGQAINNHIHGAKNDAAAGAQHATGLMNQGKPDEAEAHMQKTLTDLNINTSRVTGNAAKLVGASQTLGVRTNALNISTQSRNISRSSLWVAGGSVASSLLVGSAGLGVTLATRKAGG